MILARIVDSRDAYVVDDESVTSPEMLLEVPRLVRAWTGPGLPANKRAEVWINPQHVRIIWEQGADEDWRA